MNPGFFKVASLCRFETYELRAGDEDRVSVQEKRKERVNHRALGLGACMGHSPGVTAAVCPEGVPAAQPPPELPACLGFTSDLAASVRPHHPPSSP